MYNVHKNIVKAGLQRGGLNVGWVGVNSPRVTGGPRKSCHNYVMRECHEAILIELMDFEKLVDKPSKDTMYTKTDCVVKYELAPFHSKSRVYYYLQFLKIQ